MDIASLLILILNYAAQVQWPANVSDISEISLANVNQLCKSRDQPDVMNIAIDLYKGRAPISYQTRFIWDEQNRGN